MKFNLFVAPDDLEDEIEAREDLLDGITVEGEVLEQKGPERRCTGPFSAFSV